MDPQLLELAPVFEQECRYVNSSERLPTRVRFHLKGDYLDNVTFRGECHCEGAEATEAISFLSIMRLLRRLRRLAMTNVTLSNYKLLQKL